jgi:hypothetical protein
VAFQAAWYRLKGANPASTYESCQTKQFYHGRTECIRAVTTESHQFALAMLDRAHSPDSASVLLRAAVGAHRERTREAAKVSVF